MTLHSHFSPSVSHPAVEKCDPSICGTHKRKHARGTSGFVMSRSELLKFAACPQRWKLGMPEEKSDAMEWGTLIDCLLLNSASFETRYAIAPETYEAAPKTKSGAIESKPWNWNATVCKEWREARLAEGKRVVKSDDASEAWKAVARIREDERLNAFAMASQTEIKVSVDYTDDDTGLIVPVICLLDLVPDKGSEFGSALGDLKTTQSAAYEAWTRTVFTSGYHVQAAMYLDAWNAATSESRTQFAHIVQENFAPYETARRMLDTDFMTLGRAVYRRALSDYCWCLANDTWPGYDDWNASRGDVIDGWRVVSPMPWMIGAPE